jgi:peptidoglycan/LPS O-acetylase OafA/YrhL
MLATSDKPQRLKNPQPFNSVSHVNNMAAVRYILSTYVILGHIAVLANVHIPLMGHSLMAVGGFFSLSGFLLFASFQSKQSLKKYISKRARRILPPYILVVVVAAVLLVTMSDLSCKAYFLSSDFWKYLAANLSFINFLHPTLPGVFTGDEFYMPAVNGSLWTMKGEWACYLTVPFLFFILARLRKTSGGLLLLSLIILSILLEWVLIELGDRTDNELYYTLAKQFGTMLVFFYVGALINFYLQTFLKFKYLICVVCLFSFAFSQYIPNFELIVRPIATGALVIFLSLVGKWGYVINKIENVSYDMYLNHAPIIQATVYFGLNTMLPTWLLVLVTILVSYLLGLCSWSFVGKRFLLEKGPNKH